MTWSQNYAPLGSIGVSALIAALPVVVLLSLLAFWHVRAQLAALAGLLMAFAIAIFVYHMPPALTLAAAGYGAMFGLFPIGWIILNAIFIYQLSVETGQFAVLQRQVAGVSGDRRIQALLIAFSFGAFIEGAAGFRRARHAAPHARQNHRPRSATPQFDGGKATSLLLPARTVLVDRRPIGLARDEGRVARLPGDRREFRADAIPRE